MFKVSSSRIKTWRSCHYAHYLKYVLGLVRKIKAEPLQRGSILHECIEAYNNGKSWKKAFNRFKEEFYKNTFAEERVEMGDIPKMVEALLENYFYYYEDEELDYLTNELHFELPLTPDIVIEGYIDAVVKDIKKKLWSMETKSYSRTQDRDFFLFNPQSGIYTWAMFELGYSPDGVLWNIIKAKEPSKPSLTAKTGKLSVAKLDSTPFTVRKGIIELGLDPKKYKDFIDSHSFESFFYRHQIRLNKEVVKSIMEDTRSSATQIMMYGETLKDRNLGKDCSWCSYKSICQAELMGLDTDYIIKTEYEPKKEGGGKDGKKEKGTTKKRRNRR